MQIVLLVLNLAVVVVTVFFAVRFFAWLGAAATAWWRRRQMARGVEPVEILEIETLSVRGEITDVRVLLVAAWWSTDEDAAVAKSRVPLILKEAGIGRIRILWTPGVS